MTGTRDHAGQWRLRVSLPAQPGATTLHLAGSFNHWSRSAQPLHRDPQGRWSTELSLPDGTYWYKFIADGDEWSPDPTNPDRAPDGHGGENSVLRLGVEANLDPGNSARGDGRIEALGLVHRPGAARFAQRTGPEDVRLRLRVDGSVILANFPSELLVLLAEMLGNPLVLLVSKAH